MFKTKIITVLLTSLLLSCSMCVKDKKHPHIDSELIKDSVQLVIIHDTIVMNNTIVIHDTIYVMTEECLEYKLMVMNVRDYIKITENRDRKSVV